MSETDSAPSPETTTTTTAAPPPAETTGGLTSEEQTFGMLAHLAGLAGFIFPFGNIVGPLIIWLVKKDSSAFVDQEGKESLNFQITVAIAGIICIPLMFVLIGFLLLPVIAIAALILTIIAAVKASSGESYRYPLALRLIK